MKDNKTIVKFPVFTTMFIVFLVLKLTNTVDWSWWWVTAPLWLPLVLFLVFATFLFTIVGVMKAMMNIDKVMKGANE